MDRMTDNDKAWGPFTWGPWHKSFSVEWSSNGGEEEDTRNSLRITAFRWALRIWLPRMLKPWKEERESYAYPGETVVQYWPREYGFSLNDMGNGYDFLIVNLGAQTHDSSTTQNWSCHLPWKQWEMVRHSLYTPEGEHFYTEPYGKRDIGAYCFSRKEKCPACYFAFKDFDGAPRIATCHIEEREWHRGVRWFKWLKYFWPAKIRRDLDLEFDYEIGTEKGSWKGGTVGHGIDMLPGEHTINAFKRYCNMEHERKSRKYKLTFIGPCGPPEPREIRVARNRGWKQCEYPHQLSKDMWQPPGHTEGKYLTTDEMLEFIELEQQADAQIMSGTLQPS